MMRSAGVGWIGRRPVGGSRSWACRALAGCLLARAIPALAQSAKPKALRRLVRALTGRVYRAGDRISVSVTARGYQPIKAQITIRFNKIPTVGLR